MFMINTPDAQAAETPEAPENIVTPSVTDMKIELIPVPVLNDDKAKAFYIKAGFNADHDHKVTDDLRFIQLTPPGSACSIVIGMGTTDMLPGTQRIQMVVQDVKASREALVAKGIEMTEIEEFPWGIFSRFKDPDGNEWSLQQAVTPKPIV